MFPLPRKMPTNYRGRLAPSPTGLLHIGHARTFWIAAQRAIENRGTLILRNEDLDPQRSRAEFARAMIEDLRWLGIRWSEGPDCGGPYGPYSQSERRAHYLEAWGRLRVGGFLYPCTCSRKDLALAASAPNDADNNDADNDNDDEPLYPGTCRGRKDAAEFTEPAGVNWRFRIPEGEVVEFADLNLGRQRYVAGSDFSDFLVWRRDDVPAYQLAVVVDDAAMRITEIVRGADLLKSTARQLLLMRALGYGDPGYGDPSYADLRYAQLGRAAPDYFHCELVRDATGARLAKRHDALSIRHLREIRLSAEKVLEMAGWP